jgi:PhzF family phenazine biosynthesis protein
MRLPIYQIDAFTDRVFAGNPAAVVPLEAWLPDATMQAIAAENNLAETAFFVGEGDEYALRWFTPTVEVDLCGHATLAAAFVIFERLAPTRDRVAFQTLKAGTLTVARAADRLMLDFPLWRPAPVATPAALSEALGRAPAATLIARERYVAIFGNEEEVAALAPDFRALAPIGGDGVVATGPGHGDCDFVSRYFAPAAGIDEDPVTGSSHCVLVPYWAERLGKTRLRARQVSRRGGDLFCALDGDRVSIAGRAVLYLEGMITI